ncbi:hypothetical protein CANTEDRAFT_113855 [Yamadazyma tenuis ATCC 10573]|uniref:Uncharacterized protein n=1 Tax=Candida tenuis (strain ATCC 10573 / BCRC 21748 / CBS 615 / JCM 9827 / NBRC 10315 / NRRL Y-1498 / VKM Y-70) TaxID=590646 RepID=G3B4G4_CANTC|nr:uncharacterized protein CANTEDRAFT_113855 [Yamadazyma tenuis ATCC 10573]EGV63821.1 hypothetical protein CANTEDRAFT_113855 [Yamadazyma tenuis ATCC 10573]
MSSIFTSRVTFGLIAGLSIPPLVTKFVLEPYFIHTKFNEIDDIKHDIDHIGWHVRNLEELKGLKGDDVYVPVSYFQGRY